MPREIHHDDDWRRIVNSCEDRLLFVSCTLLSNLVLVFEMPPEILKLMSDTSCGIWPLKSLAVVFCFGCCTICSGWYLGSSYLFMLIIDQMSVQYTLLRQSILKLYLTKLQMTILFVLTVVYYYSQRHIFPSCEELFNIFHASILKFVRYKLRLFPFPSTDYYLSTNSVNHIQQLSSHWGNDGS